MSDPVTDLKRELLAAAERQHQPASVQRPKFRAYAHSLRLLPIGVATAIAAAAALFVTAPWSSSAPQSWTPARMETALGDFGVKLVGVVTTKDHFSPALSFHADESVSSAHCRGLGAHTRASYALFHCQLLYADRKGEGGNAYSGSYWTRPWTASTVCVSDVSRGTCPPPLPPDPLRGDPRKCMKGWYVRCIAETARLAATKDQGVTYKRCVAGAVWITYTCTRTGARANVEFIRHRHSWTTSVTSR
jgi:hypothetical protein